MEWEKQEPRQQQQQEHEVEELLAQQQDQQRNGSGGLYVKVMTDEQMEILRKQISVYATICEKLVEMHKSITAQQDLAGTRLGSLYCDPLMTSAGHKITARQRWTPTPVQLQILEQIFDQGNGTPSKQKIKDITDELTKHGQISETNVYNWFQNRRARSKRKQSVSAPNNAESEVETEVESPRDKKTKPENIQSLEMLASNSESYYFESSDIGNDMRCLDPHNRGESAFRPEHDLRSPTDMGHLSPSYRGFDQFIGKMEVPGSFNHYQPDEGYDMIS